jgi:hypothetical protein
MLTRKEIEIFLKDIHALNHNIFSERRERYERFRMREGKGTS